MSTRLYDHYIADYNATYAVIPTNVAKKMVQQELPELANMPNSMTYGDIDFCSFSNLLERCLPQDSKRFVDLGHGTGRAILAAFMLFGDKLSECRGIEASASLHKEALSAIQRFDSRRKACQELYAGHERCRIVLEEGDFLQDLSWTSAGKKCYLYERKDMS